MFTNFLYLEDEGSINRIILNNRMCILHFYTDWCKACSVTKSLIQKISCLDRYTNTYFVLVNVDKIDTNNILGIQDIRFVPYTIKYIDIQVQSSIFGSFNLIELEKFINGI